MFAPSSRSRPVRSRDERVARAAIRAAPATDGTPQSGRINSAATDTSAPLLLGSHVGANLFAQSSRSRPVRSRDERVARAAIRRPALATPASRPNKFGRYRHFGSAITRSPCRGELVRPPNSTTSRKTSLTRSTPAIRRTKTEPVDAKTARQSRRAWVMGEGITPMALAGLLSRVS